MPPPPKLFPVRRAIRGFGAAQGGAAAIEFAIVSLPFLALLFSIMELGLIFMASTTIDAATVSAARQIRTGQLQQGANNNAAGFTTLVCSGVPWISGSDCAANMSVDVRTFTSFSAISVTPPIAGNAIDQSQLKFDSGSSCSIVLVRVFYPWTLITPVLEPGLPNLGGNQRLLTTAVVFRNENYQAQGPSCG
jgi:Flp pilus assembly protein TadG